MQKIRKNIFRKKLFPVGRREATVDTRTGKQSTCHRTLVPRTDPINQKKRHVNITSLKLSHKLSI